MKEAIERASERFASEYKDQDLAKALTVDTKFYDLHAIQEAIVDTLEHPFDPAPQVKVEKELATVLPESKRYLANDAAQAYIEILHEQLIGVEKLNDKLNLIYLKRAAMATERAANGVEKIVAKQIVSQSAVEVTRQKYLQYIIDTNQYVDPRGVMQTRRSISLKLEEVYVPLTVEQEVRTVDVERLHNFYSLKQDDDYDDRSGLGVFQEDFFRTESYRPKIVNLASVVRSNVRCVVLGEPGAGKTIFTRFLSWQFANSLFTSNFEEVSDKEGNIYGFPRLPILVRVANYADAFSRNHSLSFRDYLLENCNGGDANKSILKELIASSLSDGEAIVLLDGLDEVVEASDRAEIGRKIEQFIAACHNQTRFIITSRVAGYRDVPLAGDFSLVTLHELDADQIEMFLIRWCPAAEKAQMPDLPQREIDRRSSAEVDGILKAVNENLGVRRLASNPLMLTILALIHRAGARLPSRRVELYELTVKTLLEDWELARGIPVSKIVKESEALRLLGPLAYWMHENKPSGIASEREVKTQLAIALGTARNISAESEEIETAVEDFLRRVREHTGILVERASKQYGFMHLTFEEYFTAREMIRRHNDAAKKIYEHRHNPRWEESIHLAISFVSNDYPEDAGDLIRTSILAQSETSLESSFSSSLYEIVLHRDLFYAIQVAKDCVSLDIGLINLLVESLFAIFIALKAEDDFLRERIKYTIRSLQDTDIAPYLSKYALNMMVDADPRLRMRGSDAIGWLGVVDNNTIDLLLRNIDDDNVDVRIHAVSALGWLGVPSDQVVNRLILALKDESTDVRWRAAYSLGWLNISTDNVVDWLISMLDDQSTLVRGSAVQVLGRLGVKRHDVQTALLMMLRDQNLNVRWRTATALGDLGLVNNQIALGLYYALQDEKWIVRLNASQTITKLGIEKQKFADELIELAKSSNATRRWQAVSALGHLGVSTNKVIDCLLTLLSDNERNVRSSAAAAVGWLGVNDEKTMSSLLRLLKDQYGEVRQRAAETIGRISPMNSIALTELLKLLKDRHGNVRLAAAFGIGRIGIMNDLVVESLVNVLLTDEKSDVRFHAASALGYLGSTKEIAISALIKTLKYKHSFVREKAAEVLGKLAPIILHESEVSRLIPEALYTAFKNSNNPLEANRIWAALWEAVTIH